MPHNEGRGNPLLAGGPHLQGQGLGVGGWQHGHHYGSGPPNSQEIMTMLAIAETREPATSGGTGRDDGCHEVPASKLGG